MWLLFPRRKNSNMLARSNKGDLGADLDAAPIPWKDVFGIDRHYTWFLPIDPVFEDYDKVMEYSTVPRLQREKKLADTGVYSGGVEQRIRL